MSALTRIAKTALGTLAHTFYIDETATDSSTTVTVAVTDATGAAVSSGNATHGATGVYTYVLPAQAALASLTVVWSATIAATAVTETDYAEIAGGFLFTLAEARASDTALSSVTKYPTADIVAARLEVEVECEEICDRAFVPRYRRAVLDGTGSTELVLPDHDIRTIRAASIAPETGGTFTALTAAQLAALSVTSDSVLRRADGSYWTEGAANVIVQYEYGLNAPPADLKREALTRLRSRLNKTRTGIPDRAVSYTVDSGGTYRLDMPGAYKTGIPDVDAVYSRYSLRSGAGTGEGGHVVPSSRTLNYDPQRGSLFHDGIR